MVSYAPVVAGDEGRKDGMVVGLIFVILVVALVFGAIGSAIGSGKGRGTAGFWLGFFLGAIGLIIVAVMQPTPQAEAERLVQVQAALGGQHVRNMPQSIVGPGTAQSVDRSLSRWVPPLNSKQWADALEAAHSQPAPRSQQLRRAILQDSGRSDTYGWLFGSDSKERAALIVIYSNRIKMTECYETNQGCHYAYGDEGRVTVRVRREADSNVSEIAIQGEGFHDLAPPEAVSSFVKVALQTPWIAVTEDSDASTPVPVAAPPPVPVAAPPPVPVAAPPPVPLAAPPPVPLAAPPLSVADELAKLAKLKADGVLTDGEFAAQKAKLLS
jgi:hypothetical protein